MTEQQHYHLLLQSMIAPTRSSDEIPAPKTTAQLDELKTQAYAVYRQRWLQVPGDHAPGKLLVYERWFALMLELAGEIHKAEGAESSKRETVLRRALLLT